MRKVREERRDCVLLRRVGKVATITHHLQQLELIYEQPWWRVVYVEPEEGEIRGRERWLEGFGW